MYLVDSLISFLKLDNKNINFEKHCKYLNKLISHKSWRIKYVICDKCEEVLNFLLLFIFNS